MSDSPEYTLRWRGRQSGPYPVSEINRMLDDHKIGMGHEIFCEDEWITLEMYEQAPHYPNTVAELVEIKRRAKQPQN